MFTPETYLKDNSYPGRGIIIGKSACGKQSVIVYFIMGRSENSRNRVFVQEGSDFRTKAFDPSKLVDPSLIIYYPLRTLDGTVVVTNGDQTDTIYSFLKEGKSFEDALRTRTFEPDAPNYTPRISGLVNADGSYQLSILKTEDGDENCTRRYFFDYNGETAGRGHIIPTYSGDGSPLPSFCGEPVAIEIKGDCKTYAERVWESLNADNRVSLLAVFTDLETGERESFVINKNN